MPLSANANDSVPRGEVGDIRSCYAVADVLCQGAVELDVQIGQDRDDTLDNIDRFYGIPPAYADKVASKVASDLQGHRLIF